MKLTIEVEITKTAGADCDESEVFEALDTEWDGYSVYPTADGADDDSDYTVTSLRLITKES